MIKLLAIIVTLAFGAAPLAATEYKNCSTPGTEYAGNCERGDTDRKVVKKLEADKPTKPDKPDKPDKDKGPKGNNGHGNDPDGNDSSNPGNSNNGDGTDADGTPGKGGGKGKNK